MRCEEMFRSTEFKVVDSTRDIDAGVLAELDAFLDLPGMADPSEPYDQGCKRMPGVPSRKLTFAGKAKRHAFVLYEAGGFAVMRYLTVFDVSQKKPRIVWHGQFGMEDNPKNLDDLKKLVAAGKIIDHKKLGEHECSDEEQAH